MPHRPSKSELRARDRLLYNLYYLQRDDFIDITLRDQVPEAWHTLELDVECSEPKENHALSGSLGGAAVSRHGPRLSGAHQPAAVDLGADENRR